MPLRRYKNTQTGEVIESLKTLGDPWEEILIAPGGKFTVIANPGTGTQKLKDSKRILTERARNHARDVDGDDNIQLNRANGLEKQVNVYLLNEKGRRRTKLDDL